MKELTALTHDRHVLEEPHDSLVHTSNLFAERLVMNFRISAWVGTMGWPESTRSEYAWTTFQWQSAI
jgi:hypothetical protein